MKLLIGYMCWSRP